MTMNQAPSRVRAVARVGADPAETRGPAIFVRRRRHGYLGPVNVMQLVLVEALAVLLILLFRQNPYLLIGGVVLAALALVVTFARSGGRWWLERVMLRRQYRRRRASPHLPATDIRLVALHRLAPDLTVQTVECPDGTPLGIGRDGAGSFAAVAVLPPDGLNGDPVGEVPLSRLAAIVHEAEQPGAVVQVVRQVVPVPTTGIAPGQPAAESYRELAAQYGRAMPADQMTWIAVRLDTRTVAEAAIGGADEPRETQLMLATLVRRVGKALRRAGLGHQVLNGDGLLEALSRSCDLELPNVGSGSPVTSESWSAWRSANLEHASFWVDGWPGLAATDRLLDAMSRTPAAQTTVALILAPFKELVELRCLLRVAAEPGALGQTCSMARRALGEAGGHAFRLDGEQAPAVYATVPSGGGAR